MRQRDVSLACRGQRAPYCKICSVIAYQEGKTKLSTLSDVLNVAAMISDPVGIVSIFVVRIKGLLEEIWLRGIDWDDEFPEDLKIQEKSDPKSWNHCGDREGLADIVSRGASIEHLLQNKLWWLRPDRMCSERELYGHCSTEDIPTDVLECEKTKTVVFLQ
ncbi:hypothetical protein TNCV_87131 [Trichonephila clavipes]|nr:hypothetical protein TNCV_87131 [Trichonephila clavipes]